MKKIIGTAIAASIGTALLLGGAGTFALWNDSVELAPESVTAGTLTLTANDDGVFSNRGTEVAPEDFRIIPGETVTFTQTLAVTAVGDDLTAQLTHAPLTVTSSSLGMDKSSLSPELGGITLTSNDPNISVNGDVVTVTPGSGTVTATITLHFPSLAGPYANMTQGVTMTLDPVVFSLTQTV